MKHLLSKHHVLKDIRKKDHEDIADYNPVDFLSEDFSKESDLLPIKRSGTQKIPQRKSSPYNFEKVDKPSY
jgi:hypothetical protein